MRNFKLICQFLLALLLVFTTGQPLLAVAQTVQPQAILGEIGSSAENPIKVLKIVPGEHTSTLTETVPREVTIDGSKIHILLERITMPEFIGKTTKLNGYYDVIQIDNQYNSGFTVSGQRPYSAIVDNGKECKSSAIVCNVDTAGTGLLLNWSDSQANLNYNENDITNRKAQEIIEFAESGQLVFFDQKITAETTLDNTILEKVLSKGLEGKSEFYNSATRGLSLEVMASKYLQGTYQKRQTFSVEATNQNNQGRQLNFNISVETTSETIQAKLFLDINADGLFDEQEIYADGQFSPMEVAQTLNLTYSMPTEFIGVIDWKIELESSKVKSYQTGSFTLDYINGAAKKAIKVLQITPSNTNLIDLSVNSSFKTQLAEANKKGYQITIETKKVNQITDQTDFQIYDMIILGFADSYGKDDQFANHPHKNTVLTNLVAYAKTGKSMMFTHDTISATNAYGTPALTQNFRAALGQARFDDFVQASKAVEGNRDTTKDFEGNTIPYVATTNKNIYGLNMYGGGQQKMGDTIYQTNGGQITTFPFELESQTTFNVANTHNQWFQLNLEDETVVPWYNLITSANKYDSKNNYYTYSKGNLTYSGTGHGNGFTTAELRLFVNTIVKAERGANHAPVITTDLSEMTEIAAPAANDLSFNVSATDIDNDQVQLEVKLDNQVVQSIPLQNSGTNNQVTISKDLLKEIGTKTVTISAVDARGAEAQLVTRTLQLVNTPVIEATATAQQGLLGDVLQVPVKLELKNTSATQEITQVEVKFSTTSTDLWEIKNPTQAVTVTDNQAEITYEIQPKAEFANTLIPATVTYQVNGTVKTMTFNIAIAAKQGKFDVRVVDVNGNPLTTTDTAVKLNGEQRNIYINQGSRVDITTFAEKALTSQAYTAEFIDPSTLNLEIQDTCVQTSLTASCTTSAQSLPLNYENPYYRITYKVEQILPAESPIRMLEIQPADSFEVSAIGGWVRTGQEEIGVNGTISNNGLPVLELLQAPVNPTNRPVIVEHMTMSEFIASTKKVNGLYDIIILGNSNGSTHFTTANNASDQLAYATYSKQESKKVSNDITQRRLDELTDYIDSGQLFYVDSKLHSNGVAGTIVDGIKGITGENVIVGIPTLTAALSTYNQLEGRYKAAEIGKIAPATDTYETELGNPSNRLMNFIVSASDPSQSNEAVQLQLTLDINGDGLFKEDEIVVTQNVILPLRNHSFTYEMPSDFVGLLDWKIELVKSSTGEPIRSADFGQTLFRRLGKKKLIRVLQVIPYPTDKIGDNIQKSLNLSQNEKWKELIGKVPDYQFEFTAMSTADFNNDNKRPELNGNFDMVILGFADAYNGQDLTANSVAAVKAFVETGQGLMLTHDTLLYAHKPDGNLVTQIGPISGQLKDYRQVTVGSYENQTKRVYQMNEALITNYPFDLSKNIDENNLIPIRRTHAQWAQLDLENENVIPWYTMAPNTVTTSGSIEDYPSQSTTGDDYTDNSDKLADTSKINQYDARNNYYTYSYKNITFSGTGENTMEIHTQYPESEMQLFVNTIVRAERAMNHAPTFTTQNIPQEIGYSNSQNDSELIMLDFSVIPRDIDRDMMSVQAILKDH
ncbi:MAG: DUF5057 domain-containing protein, partial [Culicoidibacterales bacterium]